MRVAILHAPWRCYWRGRRILGQRTRPKHDGHRPYHELSFATPGSPLNVLEYCKLEQENDREAPPPDGSNSSMVRVKILYAPWNPADMNTVEGVYPGITHKSRYFPERTVAGSEGLGIVTHGNDAIQKGDVVTFLHGGVGNYRSSLWISPSQLLSLPTHALETIGGPALSTLPQLGGTALRMLQDFGPTDVVIQNAGNSSVGMMVSQLASVLGMGCVSLVRRHDRTDEEWSQLVEYLKTVGRCTWVVAEEDLTDRDRFQTFLEKGDFRHGCRLALNAVGGESAIRLARCLETGGTLVTYGGMSKKPVSISTSQLIFRDLRFRGYWHSQWRQSATRLQQEEMLAFLLDAVW
eukprot:CAMPEP_0116824504 /NCGR_PEP_ID=MMETSP0418-20121206/1436_1 /TAXON_ID=1158023 /ORGANISM="Astrosyne radiata, Strain 13vi08-1A" /LENGTH=349 /DNA_ID=CAMNT_0004452887 /DNA_START=58 /DNA_END=1104 /DNA_ORIENTATION=-